MKEEKNYHPLFKKVLAKDFSDFFKVKIIIDVKKDCNFQDFLVGEVIEVSNFGRDYVHYNKKNNASFIPKYCCEKI